MSARENFLSIEGNLVANPEVRFTPSGKAVTTITIAHNTRRLVDGAWEDGDVSYFDVVCWETLAENVGKSIVKGDRITVTGSLNQRSWVNEASGEKRYKVEINAEMVSPSLRFATTEIHKTSFGRMDAPAKLAVVDGRTFEPASAEPELEEAPF